MESIKSNFEPRRFLSTEELIELTGKKRSNAQVRFLRKRGIPFLLNGNNQPIVLIKTIEEVLGVRERTPNKTKPNFEALKQLQ